MIQVVIRNAWFIKRIYDFPLILLLSRRWVKIQIREATMNFICFAIWFWKYVISFFLRKILNRMNWADFPMMVKKKSEKLETLGIQMIIQHASICATMILFFLAKIAYKDLRILRFKIWKSKLFAYKHINHYFGQKGLIYSKMIYLTSFCC